MKNTRLILLMVVVVIAPMVRAKEWQYRLAYNYCTLSYTFAFYGREDWKSEIAALHDHGFNTAPIEAGLAKVWQLTLKEIGANDSQIAAFLPDTAARAWWCMGNLEGLGGPLSQAEIDRDAALGKFIAGEMRHQGIEPIFQGFTGLVPHDAEAWIKDVKIVQQGKWCGGFIRPAILDPTSERFGDIAKIWYRNLKKVYGIRPKYFGADLFHEGGNAGGIDVTAAARAVQREMIGAGGEKSVWFIQSWQGTPSAALLKGLNRDNTVILALVKDMANGDDPKKMRNYGDMPWLWCEVSNFGGKAGLYGGIPMMSRFDRVINSERGRTLAGMGMLSEGLGTNPLWYEFFYEVMRRGDKMRRIERAELLGWLDGYAKKRYGFSSPEIKKALTLLVDSVYSPDQLQEGPSENILCAKPAWEIKRATSWGTTRRYWRSEMIREASKLLDKACTKPSNKVTAKQRHNLNFDRVDCLRQVLQDELYDLLPQAKESTAARQEFLKKIGETEHILAEIPEFTYDYWSAKAHKFGGERAQAALWRMVTDWSGQKDALDDYSQRQWAGLIRRYYLPRWKAFMR